MLRLKFLKPLQNLWILFSLQAAVLIFFLIAFVFLQPRLARLVGDTEKRNAKWPLVEQRIKTASPEQLLKDSRTLIDINEENSKFIESTQTDIIRIFGDICFVLSILTVWLGLCIYQLHRQNRKDGEMDKS